MANIMYGVDIESNFTPLDVRDAILICFKEAHAEILNEMYNSSSSNLEEVENFKKMDVKTLVKKMFEDVGGDYDNPTRESLASVASALKEFATNFRAGHIVGRHYDEIMALINKLN